MKNSLTVLLVNILVAGNLLAADIPSDFEMSCWDGTFAYNTMDVGVNGKKLEVKLKGMSLDENAILNPTKERYVELTLKIDKGLCKVASEDMRILNCSESNVELEVRSNQGHGPVVHTEVRSMVVITHLLLSASSRLSLDGDSVQTFEDDSLSIELKPNNSFAPSIFNESYRTILNPKDSSGACGGKITI